MIKLSQKNCKFLMTGATGFIGSRLCEELLKDGHKITALTRQKNKFSNNANLKFINEIGQAEFDFDIVINLAGETISKYWSKKNKNKIYTSRIDITRQIVEKIMSAKNPPKLFISGSAIGYYGNSPSVIFTENSAPFKQNLFSQKICQDWENLALSTQEKTRVAILRTGVVIGKNGGIVKKLSLPFKFGLGGNIGSGKQVMSWIHIDDVVGIVNLIINNSSINGAVNLVAPQNCSNAEFSKALAKKFRRPCFFHMPKFLVKILFGKMGEELMLGSQRVAPLKVVENNYDFRFTIIDEALKVL